MDKISLDRILLLHPKVREDATKIYGLCEEALKGRAKIRISQGLRTIEEQNELYKLGRTKVNPDGRTPQRPLGNKVTNAEGGESYHNYGLAVDFMLLLDGKTASWDMRKDWDADKVADWMEVVKIFMDHGWEWGGNWKSLKDYPHFQKTFGYRIADLKIKYNKKDFMKGSNIYLNL